MGDPTRSPMTEPTREATVQWSETVCLCGATMLRQTTTLDGVTLPVRVFCLQCGRTPIDLLVEITPPGGPSD